MATVVYLNGEFVAEAQAKVSVFDRGFLFADSLYEVIPFYQGVGFRLEEHLARLRLGMRAIKIESALDFAALCSELVARNGGGNQAVYLQITRGTDSQRRFNAPPLSPTVVMFSYPIAMALSGALDQITGIRVITTEDQRWHQCDIKTTALLPNIMALHKALEAGAQEALLVRDGLLMEGTSSNVFVVTDNCIKTPALSSSILGGTTRKLILELARQDSIPIEEAELPVSCLANAQEVWISSSTRGLIPVVAINGRPVAGATPGPLWHRMATLYRQFEQQLLARPSTP